MAHEQQTGSKNSNVLLIVGIIATLACLCCIGSFAIGGNFFMNAMEGASLVQADAERAIDMIVDGNAEGVIEMGVPELDTEDSVAEIQDQSEQIQETFGTLTNIQSDSWNVSTVNGETRTTLGYTSTGTLRDADITLVFKNVDGEDLLESWNFTPIGDPKTPSEEPTTEE